MNTPLATRILTALVAGSATPERLAAVLCGSRRTLPIYPLNGPSTPPAPAAADAVSVAEVRACCRELLAQGRLELDSDTRAARVHHLERTCLAGETVHVIDPLSLPSARLSLPVDAQTAVPRIRVMALRMRGEGFTARSLAVPARLPETAVTRVLQDMVAAGELSSSTYQRRAMTPQGRETGPVLGQIEIYREPELAIFAEATARFGAVTA